MITVDLIYGKSCPHVAAARQQMLSAFTKLGLTAHWDEWEVEDPKTPIHLRNYGSPTILVDGEDVAGPSPHNATNCCRIYLDRDHTLRGTPSTEQIISALCRARSHYC